MINTFQHVNIPVAQNVGSAKGASFLINRDAERPELLEIRIGDEIAVIDKNDLYTLLYISGTSDQQDAMTPVRETKVTHFNRIHNVVLKKDMKSGTKVRLKCSVSVPTMIVDGLKGIMGRSATTGLEKPISRMLINGKI